MKRYISFLIFLLVACSTPEPTAVSPTPTTPPTPPTTATAVSQSTLPPATIAPTQPAATASATAVVAETAVSTATTLPTATAPTQPVITAGRTDDGAYFRGDPNAPITMIDYSDFL